MDGNNKYVVNRCIQAALHTAGGFQLKALSRDLKAAVCRLSLWLYVAGVG